MNANSQLGCRNANLAIPERTPVARACASPSRRNALPSPRGLVDLLSVLLRARAVL